MSNWTRCRWSIVIGQVWECETCGATAEVPLGDRPLRCDELDRLHPTLKQAEGSGD